MIFYKWKKVYLRWVPLYLNIVVHSTGDTIHKFKEFKENQSPNQRIRQIWHPGTISSYSDSKVENDNTFTQYSIL